MADNDVAPEETLYDDIFSELDSVPEEEIIPQPDPAPIPPATNVSDSEISALEHKIEQIHDLATQTTALSDALIEAVSEMSKQMDAMQLAVIEHKEIAIRAWALVCPQSKVESLRSAFKRGTERAAKICKDQDTKS
jgi:hypothetical protein